MMNLNMFSVTKIVASAICNQQEMANSLVNISSTLALLRFPDLQHYGATKSLCR